MNDFASPIGGAENITRSIRDELRRRGHDVRILACDVGADHPDAIADYTCRGYLGRFTALHATYNRDAARKIRSILQDFAPDLVHLRMFLTQISAAVLPALAEVPTLYHVTWYRAICPNGLKLLPDKSVCQIPAGLACVGNGCIPPWDFPFRMAQLAQLNMWRKYISHTIANSDALRRELELNGWSPVQRVWNGTPDREVRPPLTSPPTVVFAGRLVEEKGCEVLVKAFLRVATELPDASLRIAGSGPELGRLQALTHEAGISDRVTFLGQLTRPEMESTFNDAWVQVVPSICPEPFGVVISEAMMRGTPVIASRIGGMKEVVREGETGFLAAPGDSENLAQVLLHLLRKRNLAEGMGMAARAFALEHLSMRTFVDQIEAAYATAREKFQRRTC